MKKLTIIKSTDQKPKKKMVFEEKGGFITARYWRYHFRFVKDKTTLRNIAYQLQYLHFLVQFYNEYKIVLTMEAYLFKSIIFAVNCVIEACLYSVIQDIRIENRLPIDKTWNSSYFNLIKQASCQHKIINKELESSLHQIRKIRNYQHLQSNNEKELNFYSIDDVNNALNTLSIFQKNMISYLEGGGI